MGIVDNREMMNCWLNLNKRRSKMDWKLYWLQTLSRKSSTFNLDEERDTHERQPLSLSPSLDQLLLMMRSLCESRKISSSRLITSSFNHWVINFLLESWEWLLQFSEAIVLIAGDVWSSWLMIWCSECKLHEMLHQNIWFPCLQFSPTILAN